MCFHFALLRKLGYLKDHFGCVRYELIRAAIAYSGYNGEREAAASKGISDTFTEMEGVVKVKP